MNEEIFRYFPHIIFTIILFTVIYLYYRERKRDKDINEFINKNGFTPESTELIISFLGGGVRNFLLGWQVFFGKDLKIFNIGHAKRVRNGFSVNFNNSKIYFFDYNYTVGGGKSSTTYSLTIAVFKSANNIPQFHLRPEGFLDKISELFGYNDIDFEHRPLFSKKYYLKSNDEIGVRNLFNDMLIEFFESNPNFYAESNNNIIAIYKYSLLDPKNYSSFIDDVKNILTLMKA